MHRDDNDLQELETELRRLRPRMPGARLHTALASALNAGESAQASSAIRWWRWGVPLAAAAAIAIAFLTPRPSAPSGPVATAADAVALTAGQTDSAKPNDRFEPVAAAAIPLEERSESLVTLEDGTLARRTRETYLATITWKNPRTQAALTWSVPREEVRVVPVVFQ